MRLIDWDVPRKTLVDWLNWYTASDAVKVAVQEVVDILDEAPTIDAEPVVRCKDCKHRQNPKECYMCFTEVEDIEGGRMYKFTDLTYPDGFCHKGEKMDGGKENDCE